MSKINIPGIVGEIKSKANVYTPIIEAMVNSIDAIVENRRQKPGNIEIVLKRDNLLELEDSLPNVRSVEIRDDGIGFNQKNRDSFDTFYSADKKDIGGKGFGRFMFLKYFDNVRVESWFKEGSSFKFRKFIFGKEFDIVINETVVDSPEKRTGSIVQLNGLLKDKTLDKNIDTIAKKLLERTLIFFINDNFVCPKIVLSEGDGSARIVLNEFLQSGQEIHEVLNTTFDLESRFSDRKETFHIRIYKIFFAGSLRSKISLCANNREVTETSLHTYVPEFEDEFFDLTVKGEEIVRKNYIVKSYVQGEYLNRNVSVERETFNFDENLSDPLYEFSQADIEKAAADIMRDAFAGDVKIRTDRKKEAIAGYVNEQAPWHKPYLKEINLNAIAYNPTPENIELEIQRVKFRHERNTRRDIADILSSSDGALSEKFSEVISRITEIGKSDLAHYVSNRKVVLNAFVELLKRNDDGQAKLEEEIHDLIFPRGADSSNSTYEDHNLWILDERLVFSEYIASDRRISSKKGAKGEPDLVIFDRRRTFRGGDNEFSNPLTVFEFKRPKRTTYKADEDPVQQIGKYIDDIRAGKYEMPEGLETVKVNANTPVYGFIICDIVDRIAEFARNHQLTISPDGEGYFGFHAGYKMYVEILSFKKMMKDANLRNKIFFKKLQID